MAWTTGTHSGYRDMLAQLVTFATANGWTTMRSLTNYSYNAITDEREVVLRGDCGAATLPHVGFRTFTEAAGVQGILLAGFSGYSAAAFGSLPNASPVTAPSATAGTYVHTLSGGGSFWLSVTPRRICGVVKAAGSPTAYISFYAGLLDSFSTEVEDAFPFFLGSSSAVSTQAPNSTGANVTGIVEAYSPASVTGPCYWFRSSDATWREVKNSEAGTASSSDVLYPMGKPTIFQGGDAKEIVAETIAFYNGIGLNTRGSATRKLLPTTMTGGAVTPPVPVVLISTPDGTGTADDRIVGALRGVWWVSGAKSDGSARAAEDTVTHGSRVLRVFVNGAQSQMYSYFGIEQA